jgi:cell cycle checkpoint control protein RAD9A
VGMSLNRTLRPTQIEILKQPLHTTIAVDTLEFGEFAVEEKLHIVISVKDFKAIVAHAGITNIMVKALYSHPSSPMQVTYSEEGISSEFILMTIGESRAASATPATNAARMAPKRPASKQPLESTPGSKRLASEMPPPPPSVAPSRAREAVKARVPLPPPSDDDPHSLFVPNDDDRRWDPAPYDDEEDEMLLLWDDNMDKQVRLLQSS